MRIDKWLWATRLFKTRPLAAKACSAGKIKRANKSLKPASIIAPGDHLDIPSQDGTHKRHIEIIELHEKRVGAPIAIKAYIDHTPVEILEAAKKARAEQRQNRLHRKEGDQGRMTKKQRRDWRKGLHSEKTKENP